MAKLARGAYSTSMSPNGPHYFQRSEPSDIVLRDNRQVDAMPVRSARSMSGPSIFDERRGEPQSDDCSGRRAHLQPSRVRSGSKPEILRMSNSCPQFIESGHSPPHGWPALGRKESDRLRSSGSFGRNLFVVGCADHGLWLTGLEFPVVLPATPREFPVSGCWEFAYKPLFTGPIEREIAFGEAELAEIP
jgi:hypothetical protein